MKPDPQIELHALSAMMKSSGDTYAAINDGLLPAYFTDPSARRLFHAIVDAATKGTDTGVQAVWSAMGNDPNALPTLIALDNMQPTSARRAELVGRVIDAFRCRQLADLMGKAFESARTDSDTFAEAWDAVAPHIQAAQQITANNRARPLSEIAESLIEQIEKPDTRKTVPTPWRSWDMDATPIKAGELITIAGRPGTGKTALAVQLADKAQAQGSVAVFSLEMAGEELIDRMSRQRVAFDRTDGRDAFIRAIRSIGGSKRLHVFDTQNRYAMATIESHSRLLSMAPGGLALIVVDYLQLIDPTDRRAPREQQVAEMSRRFKQLAGALKCPVLLLAQLNRESEKDERRPKLSDLRESGAIEQDSDRVWFLWRDPSLAPAGQEGPCAEVQLIQAKCRAGPANIAKKFMFNRPAFRFDPIQF
jgi:replicative DNA helicase